MPGATALGVEYAKIKNIFRELCYKWPPFPIILKYCFYFRYFYVDIFLFLCRHNKKCSIKFIGSNQWTVLPKVKESLNDISWNKFS